MARTVTKIPACPDVDCQAMAWNGRQDKERSGWAREAGEGEAGLESPGWLGKEGRVGSWRSFKERS